MVGTIFTCVEAADSVRVDRVFWLDLDWRDEREEPEGVLEDVCDELEEDLEAERELEADPSRASKREEARRGCPFARAREEDVFLSSTHLSDIVCLFILSVPTRYLTHLACIIKQKFFIVRASRDKPTDGLFHFLTGCTQYDRNRLTVLIT